MFEFEASLDAHPPVFYTPYKDGLLSHCTACYSVRWHQLTKDVMYRVHAELATEPFHKFVIAKDKDMVCTIDVPATAVFSLRDWLKPAIRRYQVCDLQLDHVEIAFVLALFTLNPDAFRSLMVSLWEGDDIEIDLT